MDSPEDVMRASGEPQNCDPGVNIDDASPPPSKRARLDTSAKKDSTFDCPICCCTSLLKDGTFISRCGHRFCQDCWREYIVTKVKDEGQCSFKCMQDGCPTYMDEPSIERLAPGTTFQRCVLLCIGSCGN